MNCYRRRSKKHKSFIVTNRVTKVEKILFEPKVIEERTIRRRRVSRPNRRHHCCCRKCCACSH